MAILDAAARLIGEVGFARLGLTAVARRAGVSTATVYRRWSSKDEFLLDAITALLGVYEQPDRGDVYVEAREFLERRHATMTTPLFLAALPAILDETCRQTPLGARFYQSVLLPLSAEASAIHDRAVARGEIAETEDRLLFVDLLVGPVLRRLLHTGRSVSPAFLDTVARTVVGGLRVAPRAD